MEPAEAKESSTENVEDRGDISSGVSESNSLKSVTEEAMIEKLTEGFTAEMLPQLQELREKTKELTKNQAVLIETMQHENRKFAENKEIEEFNEMVATVRSYYGKLRNIKNEMDLLNERMGKIKKRSLKLKDKRLKRESDEAQKQEREHALERELTAKPAT